MYSGNHGIGYPLDTLLEAAARLKDDRRVAFVFIGEGIRKADVERMIQTHHPSNVFSLPYQPRSEVACSLSAADVHVVSVGENMTGIIHPCKIYGAMAAGRPILLLGPIPNYASSLVADHQLGWLVEHGDVDRMVAIILEIIESRDSDLEEMGRRSRALVEEYFSQERAVGRFCDLIEGHQPDEAAALVHGKRNT
jgi:glycosyltransferase involved in cell wall biosynthesis